MVDDTAWASVEAAGDPPTEVDGPRHRAGTHRGAPPSELARPTRRRSAAQLGRAPRAIHDVGHRCPCGNPDVVTTEPRLADGTPFPTTFYLTCPRAASLIGTLEASGLMKEMQDRLGDRPRAGGGVRRRARGLPRRARTRSGTVPEIDGISAGGMPDRVKCLHVLAGQALAQGRGVNPLGDEVLDLLGDWWAADPASSPGPVPAQHDRVAAIDCGTNTIKLLVADLPGRHGRWSARPGWSGSARTSTAPAGWPTRRWRARSPRSTSTPPIGRHAVERSASAPPRPPATPATATVFAAGVRDRLGVDLEVLTGDEEAALSFDGAVRGLREAPADPCWSSTSAAARPSWSSARPRRAAGTRWTSARCGCTSGTCTPTRRRPAEVAAATADIDAHLDA